MATKNMVWGNSFLPSEAHFSHHKNKVMSFTKDLLGMTILWFCV